MSLKKAIGIGLIGVMGMVGTVGGLRSCSCVQAGHVGIVDVLGSVQKQAIEPGINWPVHPISKRVEMDVRTQEAKESMHVPTKEGLMATLEVSVLYHLSPDKATEVYKTVGTGYKTVIIESNLRNIARDVVAGYASEDLYSINRQKIASEIQNKLKAVCAERGITLESVLLRGVSLPAEVTQAIETKIKAKQQAEQMEYTLQKESQEAERKRVEAGGIADAQHIIASSLTKEYLQWNYTKTMSDLAHSPNTTFVITPYDTKLVPMLPLEDKTPNVKK